MHLLVVDRTTRPAGWFPQSQADITTRPAGMLSSVAGEIINEASGTDSTVSGGRDNEASGDYSFATGRCAKATHEGSIVFDDSTDADFNSTGDNQFSIRVSGGYRLLTDSGGTTGVSLGPGAVHGLTLVTVMLKRTSNP